jgi:hypothetical protein
MRATVSRSEGCNLSDGYSHHLLGALEAEELMQ